MDDAPNLPLALIVLGLFFAAPRLAVSAGRVGDVVAQLFVPPNRGLGWPHGVQESDEPWGWHVDPGGGGPRERAPELDDPLLFELVDVVDLAASETQDGLLIEVHPVPSTPPHRLAA
jgi:hypothetical protein